MLITERVCVECGCVLSRHDDGPKHVCLAERVEGLEKEVKALEKRVKWLEGYGMMW